MKKVTELLRENEILLNDFNELIYENDEMKKELELAVDSITILNDRINILTAHKFLMILTKV